MALDWTQWFYPGPRRVFTPAEMARAGAQPWPVAVDHVTYFNLVMLAVLNLSVSPDRPRMAALSAASLALGWVVLALARSLWRAPTRRRLNAYCYLLAFALTAAVPLLDREQIRAMAPMLLAVMTGGLSGLWMLTIYRVEQIEARLRELAEQDTALRLSTRLAAAQIQPHYLFNT